MSKRLKTEKYQSSPLLNAWCNVDIFKLNYSFIGAYHHGFIHFGIRQICKRCHVWWTQHLQTLLQPAVFSSKQLKLWYNIAPNLQKIFIDMMAIESIKFKNLRMLTLTLKNDVILKSFDMFSWKCSQLQFLHLASAIATESLFQTISLHLPKLTFLCANIKGTGDFTISNFSELEVLSLTIEAGQAMHLHIISMPNLDELCIVGILDSLFLRNVLNIQQIWSDDSFTMKKIMSLIDPYHQIMWKNIKQFRCVHNQHCAEIYSQLEIIEELSITECELVADIDFSKFTQLWNLTWDRPNWDFLNDIGCLASNLKSLDLRWNDDDTFILDFTLLAQFLNLQNLYLRTTNGNYTNFDAIVSFKNLSIFHCLMENLTISEHMKLQQCKNIPHKTILQ
jgi:hypothetical protein